jgi:hypothetical protein
MCGIVRAGDAAMRCLNLLIVSIVVALSGIAMSPRAFAVPQPDAEQAYANGDYKTAFAIWEPLAEQGSARAAMNIARMYERGEYVAQDSAMAAEWYRKAAEQSMSDNAAAPSMAANGSMPATSQAVVAPPTVITGPVTPTAPVIAPTYVRPVTQPVYYPVIIPRPRPIGFGFRHHGHR